MNLKWNRKSSGPCLIAASSEGVFTITRERGYLPYTLALPNGTFAEFGTVEEAKEYASQYAEALASR